MINQFLVLSLQPKIEFQRTFVFIITKAYAASYWVKLGAPRHKLVIGLALYGRTFTLSDERNSGLGAPTIGAGRSGQFTGQPGYISYYEVFIFSV